MTSSEDGSAADAVLRQVLGCTTLPSLPAVALQVLDLTRDESATSADIAACVELDQALAVKILKTINSSFYGLSTPCPTISRAINYLGLNTVRSLVLGFSLVDSFGAPDGADSFDLIAHWRRAMYGAVAARLISSKIPGCDGDEAFIAAMLRDVGSLAAAIALGDRYHALIPEAEGIHESLPGVERGELGLDHSRLGGELAATWKIPDEMILAIKHHHSPRSSLPEGALVRAVSFASLAADAISENPAEAGRAQDALQSLVSKWFKMGGGDFKEFIGELKQAGSELSRLFNIDTGAPPNIDGIMAEAEEQKVRLQIEQEREAQQLRESNSELSRQRFTDGLTGALNRAAFDEALAESYEAAQGEGRSLTIAFSDADKFKSFNDTHGHQAGDAVLVELARRMQEAVGDRGKVFRYGGEEFAFLCDDLSIDESVHLAESVRESVAATPFAMNGLADVPESLSVTVSIGVAVYNDDTRKEFADAEAILKSADDAVYEAKESGRNRTCVFQSAAVAEAKATPPASPDGKLRVLIVDDDALMLKLLSSAFEKTGMAEVRSATTVTEAVKLLHFSSSGEVYVPHLVVTDLNMPGHSGVKLVRYMRATPQLMLAPIVVLSGSGQEEDIRESLGSGASAYVPKDAIVGDPVLAAAKIIDFWSIAVSGAAA